ncbi:sensor domain-containing protein [Nocardioides sp. MAHUQ-72]|uniref:sensor domain-containing protein n=1 Tax=unclassified Nocardioides TaxID=2615069 RepID=UPI0036185DA7
MRAPVGFDMVAGHGDVPEPVKTTRAATSPSAGPGDPVDAGPDGPRASARALFEQSPVPQVLYDARGVLVDANVAFCRLVGRPADELVGRPVRALLHDSDARAGRGLRWGLRRGRRSHGSERVLAGPDGRPVPALVSTTTLRDATVDRPLVIASVQDLRPLRRVERRRERQESFFLALAQRAGDLALVSDAGGQVVYVSPALGDLLDHPAEHLAAAWNTEFVHEEDSAAVQALAARVRARGGTESLVFRIHDAAGAWHWMEATVSNLLDTAVGGTLWNLRDVDDRVRAEAALRASESRYRTMADNADEGLWVSAADGRAVYVNDRLVEILGLDGGRILGRRLVDVVDSERRLRPDLAAGRPPIRPGRSEIVYRHPDGRPRTLVVSAAPLDDADGAVEGFLAMVSDVTDARRLEHELRRAALHDSLTGLPNRALLFDRLQQALARETRSTAVLFVDLDRFKFVNDVRGHVVGDELLVRVAARLKDSARPTDTVARFGGDEFLVVCEDVDEAAARLLADDLVAALDAPFPMSEGEVRLTASIGVALSPSPSPGTLISRADTAMYAAKVSGRHRVRVYDADLAAHTEERSELGSDLRRALEADELMVHHQPVVDLATGRVVGTEALARWHHPVHGSVPPDRFVSVAEEVGLAPELDRWALRRALADARHLRAAGAMAEDSYVAVNFSPHTLGDPGLDVWIAQVVRAAGFAPHQVLIEVTEGAVMADATTAVAVLTRLRDRGFLVAVDDFGTGHSSLAYLRTLPLTMLKIDRSFVAGIATDAEAQAIAASIVELARALGLVAVAEGVETPEDARMLQELGCDAAQGWLWSPAVSSATARETGALTRSHDIPGR